MFDKLRLVFVLTPTFYIVLVAILAGGSSASPIFIKLIPIVSRGSVPSTNLNSIVSDVIQSKLRLLHSLKPSVTIEYQTQPPIKSPPLIALPTTAPTPAPTPAPIPTPTPATPEPVPVAPVDPKDQSPAAPDNNVFLNSLHTSESSSQSFSVSLPLAPTVEASAFSVGFISYGPPIKAKPSEDEPTNTIDEVVLQGEPRAPLRVLTLEAEQN